MRTQGGSRWSRRNSRATCSSMHPAARCWPAPTRTTPAAASRCWRSTAAPACTTSRLASPTAIRLPERPAAESELWCVNRTRSTSRAGPASARRCSRASMLRCHPAIPLPHRRRGAPCQLPSPARTSAATGGASRTELRNARCSSPTDWGMDRKPPKPPSRPSACSTASTAIRSAPCSITFMAACGRRAAPPSRSRASTRTRARSSTAGSATSPACSRSTATCAAWCPWPARPDIMRARSRPSTIRSMLVSSSCTPTACSRAGRSRNIRALRRFTRR